VMGNPPYSGESANKGEWIMSLMEDYKKEPGGKEKLKERNPKAINDDYVKFLRYGQHFIEKNGSGILAFINPHGFLDNLTYRGMRWNLLKTYDKIYTIDLHGNAKKKETAPDGSADVNVFDIEQGVSINLFIKTGKKKPNELGKVFHFDLFGKRELKYDFLSQNNLKSAEYKEVKTVAPNYFFVTKDFKGQNNYDKGISIDKLFPVSTSGIKTHSDGTLVSFVKYENSNQYYNYRPFDVRYIEYDLKKVQRHRYSVMKHMLQDNLSIMTCRQLSTFDFQHILVSKYLVDMCTVSLQTKETTYAFPLYLYPETNGQQTIEQSAERTPNLNAEIVRQIAENLGLSFTNEKTPLNLPKGETYSLPLEGSGEVFAPIDILDYIYAVLHSPTYREKYKEFLKIDFPRVPYPKDKNTFWLLVKLGGEIRQIHL
ncbi:MAG: DNA methyltransferase, partial [Bacteroidales bacterium]|nr:DNA methyltransferase [Bacteroidales bacterium]